MHFGRGWSIVRNELDGHDQLLNEIKLSLNTLTIFF